MYLVFLGSEMIRKPSAKAANALALGFSPKADLKPCLYTGDFPERVKGECTWMHASPTIGRQIKKMPH
jgi:hypothetical protein